MSAKFTLRTLEASGFRGIGSDVTVSFHPRATVIVAPNGTGKTSILGAIEWCLFGELHYQPPENRTNDEIVNLRRAPREAQVRLLLANDSDTFEATRTKRLRQRATDFSVRFADVRVFNDNEANGACFQHLDLTFEDFYRAVYLHQESIRGLLLDEPRVRNESLDRLFGVDKLRDILRMLSTKLPKDAIGEIVNTKRNAAAKLEGAVTQAQASHERATADAQRQGLAQDDLSLDAATRLLAEVVGALGRAASSVGYTGDLAIEAPTSMEALDRAATRARTLLTAIRKQGVDLQLSSGSATALTNVDRAKGAITGAESRVAQADAAVAACVQRVGGADALQAMITRGRSTLAIIAQSVEAVGANQRVAAEAVRFLNTAPDTSDCPVCGQAVNGRELLARLQGSLEGQLRAHLAELEARRQATAEEIATAEGALRDLEGTQRAAAVAVSELEGARAAALALLGTPVQPDQIAATLDRRATELQEASSRAQQARAVAEEALGTADGMIERLRVIYRWLQSDENRTAAQERLGSLGSDESGADEQIGKLATLAEAIEAVAASVQEVASEHARSALEQAQDEYTRYYATLCNHPYFDLLRINVEQQRVSGVDRNNYVLRTVASVDGEASLASSRLSTAQMNCVALSVYLALAERLEHNLGFIILDDPSQSLDTEHKEALTRVLDELDPALQFVIATQDVEFGNMLAARWPGDASAQYSLRWSPATGTQLIPAGS